MRCGPFGSLYLLLVGFLFATVPVRLLLLLGCAAGARSVICICCWFGFRSLRYARRDRLSDGPTRNKEFEALVLELILIQYDIFCWVLYQWPRFAPQTDGRTTDRPTNDGWTGLMTDGRGWIDSDCC